MSMKEKIQQLIEQKISQWQEDDIYAISLYVFDEEDDPCQPVAVLGYNTERQVQKSTSEAYNEQEARWNYAFWLQNEEMCWGQGDTAEDVKEWITEQDLWDSEDEITPKFVELLVAIVQDIHASGLLKDKFGREIPILIHELEYYEQIAQQNIEANGEVLDRDFVSFCMPCIPAVQDELRASQNEMPRAEKRVTVPQSQVFHDDSVIAKKSTDMRKVAALIIAIVLTMSLFWILGLILSGRSNEAHEDTSKQPESFTEESEELPASVPVEGKEDTSMSSEPKVAEPVITETEIVEKNAKNTGELRISTSITKLWLNEDEKGASEINAALKEIYEAAEAEMEAYNREILDDYLFEDGVLQEDLGEWLAISTENYVASIEYVDENYLCLSMNGDNFVAGGAHVSYWSDYYVFDRHTGQRLSLEDFVNDSTEEIKEIVKARILAVAPYSKGEQSENALESNRFFLTAEGLGIHYDVYEIGDYASGSCDIIIPFELFDMKEDM